MGREYNDLYERILEGIRGYNVDELYWKNVNGLSLFHHVLNHNPVYHTWFIHSGYKVDSIRCADDIPPVPCSVFKDAWVGSFPKEQAKAIFLSSGTTRGIENRAHHPIYRLEIYREAALVHFKRMVMPDFDRMMMLIVGPGRQWAPHSSLGFMLDNILETYGTKGSLHAWNENGPDLEEATRWLKKFGGQEPVLIFGTALALADWLEHLNSTFPRYQPLMEGSRIVETGGFKGRYKEISREDFYSRLERTFGLEKDSIITEYGMTEAGSQCYDNALVAKLTGTTTPRRLVPPPWLQIEPWDFVRWKRIPERKGVAPIALRDPVNIDSLPFFVTEDLGSWDEHGFFLVGRIPGAEPRGCSLLAER